MNRLFCWIIIALVLSVEVQAEKLNLSVTAEAAILINADTGAVLYEKNPHKQLNPASITKIITAIIAIEKAHDKFDVMIAADQDCIGTVKEEALRRSNYTMPAYLLIPDGSHIGIKRGEILSLRDLMYGLMLASADDAANVIAKYVSGTIPDFVQEMNDYVKRLGCTDTNCCNPHGLYHPKHVTTAYDMAMIAREAMKNTTFREIVSTLRYTRPKTNKQEPTIMLQGNRLLRTGPYYYPKAIGVKTGYLSMAGSTLVAAAKDGERTLISVLLKAPERKDIFNDTKKMFEIAFNQPKVQRIMLKKGPQKFNLNLPGAEQSIPTFSDQDLAIEYYPAEEPKVKSLLYWQENLQLPVAKDQKVGEIIIQNENGQQITKTTLYSQIDVKPTTIHRLKNLFSNNSTLFKILGGLIAITFLTLFALQLRKAKG